MFPLWAFIIGWPTTQIHITRGRTREEAQEWIERGTQPRLRQYIMPLRSCPIQAASLYSNNHSSGWLDRKPVWLEREGR